MKKTLVIGSTCVDVIIRIDHLPKTEENLHPESQRFVIGGCAYNVANILGRGQAPVTFVTPVGLQGVFGNFVKQKLDTLPFASPVILPDSANGCCYCFVEKSGERTFMSVHGAEYTFDPSWMTPYAEESFDYGYVCGLEIEEHTGEKLVSYLENAPIDTLLYAPGPRGIRVSHDLTNRLFALHPILHLNEGEALAMSGESDLTKALMTLHQRTQQIVICTLGVKGVRMYACDQDETIPAYHVENVVDTIGAGDAHAGATLLGFSRGMSLPDALRLANRVCARVVATSGATLSDEDISSLLL